MPEVKGIFEQIRLITRRSVPFWKSLCHFACLCGQDRDMRLMDKATSRF